MIAQALFSFFTDSILRAPTLGCMLMCLAASLMGVIIFLRRQSLIGEVLSHASYPGVILGVLAAGLFSIDENDELQLSVLALIGAFITSLLGLWMIHYLERRMRVQSDAALCFVLSTFFGVGLTMTSEVQFSFTSLYKQTVNYLYGQAATMTDIHIFIYGMLALVVILMILLLYKELHVMTFDREYAKSLGISVRSIDFFVFVLVALAIIIGIRSVGVVLMSAMLIAPPVAARQLTNRFSVLLVLSALFGLLSGFFGNYFSVELTEKLGQAYPAARIILPTGPMIVLVATLICTAALLFAPERGMLIRLWRIACFRYTCICENLLKEMWRTDPKGSFSFDQVAYYQTTSRLYLRFLLWRMIGSGWIERQSQGLYGLSVDGEHRAANIVRLHRLWEVYLVNYLGIGSERVHRNAEEMEHILTPELERELTLLLENPQQDPHDQPIPARGRE
ncbi:MAG: iron chelate uptake ABC transporter family permease subunit [Parachlamydiaceae bacterium]